MEKNHVSHGHIAATTHLSVMAGKKGNQRRQKFLFAPSSPSHRRQAGRQARMKSDESSQPAIHHQSAAHVGL